MSINLDDLRQIKEYIESVENLKSGSNIRERNLLSVIESRAVECFDELKKLIKSAKALKELKYKSGDIVVHQKYGKCFIVAIALPEILNNGFHPSIDSKEAGYIVVSIQDNGMSSSVLRNFVKEDEIVPYTHATEVLYGKPE